MNTIAKKNILLSEKVKSSDEAINEKLTQLSPKLFGIFNPVPHTLHAQKAILIPYYFMEYEYSIGKRRPGEKLSDRGSEIAVMYDANEAHGFYFDLSEKEYLVLKKMSIEDASEKYEILEDKINKEDREDKVNELIKYKYLRRIARVGADITLIKTTKFYRPAMELIVSAKGKQMERYAYMDRFSLSSEHVSGLKVRLDV